MKQEAINKIHDIFSDIELLKNKIKEVENILQNVDSSAAGMFIYAQYHCDFNFSKIYMLKTIKLLENLDKRRV